MRTKNQHYRVGQNYEGQERGEESPDSISGRIHSFELSGKLTEIVPCRCQGECPGTNEDGRKCNYFVVNQKTNCQACQVCEGQLRFGEEEEVYCGYSIDGRPRYQRPGYL